MTTSRYLWNPINQNIVREYDGGGNTVASYTTEPVLYGDMVSQRRDGQDSVYHYDAQGSTLALTDSSGNVTDTYAYSAFGETTDRSGGTMNPFRYMGKSGYYTDSDTLSIDVRRRYYTPRSGSWPTTDPIQGVEPGNNVYMYCYNSPALYEDPSGLVPQSTLKCGMGPFQQTFLQCRYLRGRKGYGPYIKVEIPFVPCCKCCHFRQYSEVYEGCRQYINAKTLKGVLPPTCFEVHILREDCNMGLCYGRREDPPSTSPLDRYMPNQKLGCLYEMEDEPNVPIEDGQWKTMAATGVLLRVSLRRRLVRSIYDACQETYIYTNVLDIDCLTIFDKDKKIVKENVFPKGTAILPE